MIEFPTLAQLVDLLGLTSFFTGKFILRGQDPILASPHHLGESVSAALGLDAIAAASIWKYRTGQENDLSLDMKDAIHYLHPVHFVWQNNYSMNLGAENIQANGYFKCKDGRHVWIQCGPPYRKLENGYLNFFDCGNNRAAIGRAIAQWNSLELEAKLAELGLPCCQVRTTEEWRAHPQGKALLNVPVIEIEKISEGVPYGLTTHATAPLTGVKVIDMTHVLAGPRSSMTLAEFGAKVLHITSPRHADPKTINLGVNHGKRSAFLDLNDPQDLQQMKALLTEADVFSQSYRPSVVERFGLTATEACRHNSNGLVYLSINAFGHDGPWKDRPGFDQNAQMVSGFAVTEGSLEIPKTSPVFYINDLLTAYFAAAGVMTALLRRAIEGGSYHVKVSLTKSCMWVQDLGLISPALFESAPKEDRYPARLTNDLSIYTYPPKLIGEDSAYGHLSRLAPAVQFSNLPAIDLLPVVPYGAHLPLFW